MSRNIYKEHQPSGGGGSYLKFEDGKTVRVRIVSEPVIFESIYEKGVVRQVSTKYAWLIFNLDEQEVQIMQLPKTGFRNLAAIAADDDYGDPAENEYDLKITRTGQKQQTKYNIVPVAAKYSLTEEDQEAVADIDLVERLEASPNNERVAWLKDEVDGKRPKEAAPKSKDDVVIEDIDDEPINLDDIPLQEESWQKSN